MGLILASKSPRRFELMSKSGYVFTVCVSDADETLPEGTPPEVGVRLLAERKGAAVAALFPHEVIVSSDTLVEWDGTPLGKPRDEEEARAMLRCLSGHTHVVRTGVAVHKDGKVYSRTASTAVTFRPLSEKEIFDYVATGEPMDKAGAYGIQGIGGAFVADFDGDFDTVMGLSMKTVADLLLDATGDASYGKEGH